MAKVITTLEICENARMARDMALTGECVRAFSESRNRVRFRHLH